MTLFTIPGETTNYHYPDTLADITLWQYLIFLKDIQPSEPPEVKESTTLADMIYQTEKEISRLTHRMPDGMNAVTWLESGQATDKAKRYLPPLLSRLKEFTDGWDDLQKRVGRNWYAMRYLPYIARVVSHFTGVPYGKVIGHEGEKMHVKTVEYLYGRIMSILDKGVDIPPAYKKDYLINGEVYTLPDRYMERSTLIEFAEAAQFQQSVKDVQGGEIMALLDVISVLLRKPGEPYSEEVLERNRQTFRDLPMTDVLSIAFFLTRLSQRLSADFLTSMLRYQVTKLEPEHGN